MTAPNTAERAAVLRGAALLDEKRPSWWRDIETDDDFRISSCGRCIAGQVGAADPTLDVDAYPNELYDHGLALLGVESGEAHLYGLNDTVDTSYRGLTAAWRELIAARRAAAQHAGGNCAWCGVQLQPGEPEVCSDCLGRGLPHAPALETVR